MVNIITATQSFEKLIATLTDASAIVVDVETTGLDLETAGIVGVGLAVSGEQGFYIPLGHVKDPTPQLDKAIVLRGLGNVLAQPGKFVICHNTVFDLGVLRQADLTYEGLVFDTMVATHLVYPSEPCGLKPSAERILGYPNWEINLKQLQDKPVSLVAEYCVKDVVATYQLFEHLEPRVKKLMPLLFDLEMKFIPVLIHLSASRYLVDVDLARTLREQVRGEIGEIRRELNEASGREINWRSADQVRQFVYGNGVGDLGLPVIQLTEKGKKASTESSVLLKLASRNPLAMKLARLGVLQQIAGNYFGPIAESTTGYIRCSYSQVVQVTGRVSCQGSPNLGTMRKRDEKEVVGPLPDVRSLFVAPPKYVIVRLDYSGQEVAILAALAGERKMLEAIMQGADLHSQTAIRVFGLTCDVSEVKEHHRTEREIAKKVLFGLAYGQRAFGLARKLGIPQSRAEIIVQQFFKTYPAVRRYLEGVVNSAKRRGLVIEPAGRVRELDVLRKAGSGPDQRRKVAGALREAQNFSVQAFGSVVLREAAISIHRYLRETVPQARLLTIRHDEIQVAVPEEMAEEVIPELKRLAESVDLSKYEVAVPLRVEVEVGKRWAEFKKWMGSSEACIDPGQNG